MDEREDGSHFIGNEYSLFVTAYLVHFLAFPELSVKASLLCVTNPPYFSTSRSDNFSVYREAPTHEPSLRRIRLGVVTTGRRIRCNVVFSPELRLLLFINQLSQQRGVITALYSDIEAFVRYNCFIHS